MSLMTTPPTVLGPLEWRVLDALWRRAAPGTVRDLQPDFAEIAYTTLMTTLDRLYRKGILARTKAGRAFVYEPLQSRAVFDSQRATRALLMAVERGGGARPVLSCFVEAIGNHDEALLAELETLVRERRAERDAVAPPPEHAG